MSRALAGDDSETWLGYCASPHVAAVTVTVTEAGYLRGAGGGLDRDNPTVVAEIDALRSRSSTGIRSAPGKLVAGLAARRAADARPLILVPCDNPPGNGAIVARVVHDLAEAVDPTLTAWIESSLSTVTTMVDRITPRTSPDDSRAVEEATGRSDLAPVATEPVHEWVLSGDFMAGRPQWQHSGATFTDDILPFEHRKLWLLGGGHSLLACAGSIRGHGTVAAAVADDTCRSWLQQWWSGSPTRGSGTSWTRSPPTARRSCRYGSCRHCGGNGSRAACHRAGAVRVLAAWLCTLRGLGAPVDDARPEEMVPLARGDSRRRRAECWTSSTRRSRTMTSSPPP